MNHSIDKSGIAIFKINASNGNLVSGWPKQFAPLHTAYPTYGEPSITISNDNAYLYVSFVGKFASVRKISIL